MRRRPSAQGRDRLSATTPTAFRSINGTRKPSRAALTAVYDHPARQSRRTVAGARWSGAAQPQRAADDPGGPEDGATGSIVLRVDDEDHLRAEHTPGGLGHRDATSQCHAG